jgi:hypothetical protein
MRKIFWTGFSAVAIGFDRNTSAGSTGVAGPGHKNARLSELFQGAFRRARQVDAIKS